MLILDKGYLETRNKYIHPLSQYYIQYRQLKNYNIKNILLNNIQNVQKNPANEYSCNSHGEHDFITCP